MLWLEIVNDGTGDVNFGNYNFKVGVNNKILEVGRVEGFNRHWGYNSLIKTVTEIIEDKQNANPI